MFVTLGSLVIRHRTGRSFRDSPRLRLKVTENPAAVYRAVGA